MHGGTVTAESSLGRGSEFTVRLPAAAAPETLGDIGTAQLSDHSGTALRVLVVDDNTDAASSLGMLIQASGHMVWLAHDGEAALEAATRCLPHVVFLDIGLPKLDGYSVASRLRASTNLNVTLVAITGYGQMADRQRAHEAGFHYHLVKPVMFPMMEKILGDVSNQLRSN
jgi:CheY-like chemotaxis protein